MKNNVFVFNHPLINHKLAVIRNICTETSEFKKNVKEIANLMVYEATRDLPVEKVNVETPCGISNSEVVSKKVVIIPILRAGLGMVEGISEYIPDASVGYLGLYRDEETLEPKEYYCKLPSDIADAYVLLVDPMLATGGSVIHALDVLNRYGVEDKNIKYLGIVGAPEGLENVSNHHPEVAIYLAALDCKLNEKGYIVPGLGDCGDRLFGTK